MKPLLAGLLALFFVDVTVVGTCDPLALPGTVLFVTAVTMSTYPADDTHMNVSAHYQGTGTYADARDTLAAVQGAFTGALPERCKVQQVQISPAPPQTP